MDDETLLLDINSYSNCKNQMSKSTSNMSYLIGRLYPRFDSESKSAKRLT